MKTRGHRSFSFAVAVALAVASVAPRASFGVEEAKSGVAREDSPVACSTDADCPHLACGPCTAGAPITQSMLGGPECAVNPCLEASAVCNDRHTCEIGPRTRKNPAVWRKP
jgi:hypothetical protein